MDRQGEKYLTRDYTRSSKKLLNTLRKGIDMSGAAARTGNLSRKEIEKYY